MNDLPEETQRAVSEVAEYLGIDPVEVIVVVDETPDILYAARQEPVTTWADLAASYRRTPQPRP